MDTGETDRKWMQLALDLAERARGFTSPNPMVGAVVVRENAIVGKGFHKGPGKPHAEAAALQDAGDMAKGATLYVTLEPCNHFGRTPPCTKAVLSSGIKRVVAAAADPNPGVAGGGAEFLRSMGVEVEMGLLEGPARKLNEAFFKHITTGLPFVTLKCASTLDGRIATGTGDSKWITGPVARQQVHEMRHASDAILVGVDTVIRDDPGLTTRLEGKTGKDPLRIVLDAGLRIPETAKMLTQESTADTLVVTAANPPNNEKKARLASKGVRILSLPAEEGRVFLPVLMKTLGKEGVTSILIEGGGHVLADALQTGVGDKICLFYAPKILGGDDGVPVFRGKGPEKINDCMKIYEMDITRLGDDFLVSGYLKKVEL